MSNEECLDKINELLKRVLEKCYLISTHSKCDVFFEYSPHVNCFTIMYFKDGYNKETQPIYFEDVVLEHCTMGNLSQALINLDKLYEEVKKDNATDVISVAKTAE